jgi:hypothetical protein
MAATALVQTRIDLALKERAAAPRPTISRRFFVIAPPLLQCRCGPVPPFRPAVSRDGRPAYTQRVLRQGPALEAT